VRRSSDDAEEDFTAAEAADGTLAAFCGADDGLVKQWWDQSGNARHASQTTAGYQPKIVSSGVVVTNEGKPALEFDGTDDTLSFLTPDALKANRTKSIFGVFKGTGDSVPDFILSTRDTSANLLKGYLAYGLASGGDFWYAHIAKGQIEYSSVFVNNETAIFSLLTGSNGSSVSLAINGVLKSQAANTILTANEEAAGNSTYIMQQSTEYAAGQVSELLMYSSDLTAQRELIEGNIAWSYS
jgi:hypothetical protein